MELGIWVEVNEWYTTVCNMTQSKVAVTEIGQLQKMADFKVYLSAGMHVIKRLMVNYEFKIL